MAKKKYESPIYEVEKFTLRDVLTKSSSVDEGEDEFDAGNINGVEF